MPTLDEVRTQIESLGPGDQEELLASLAGQLRTVTPDASFPSIVSTPDVCGGDARIVRTRIPVWCIERLRQLGGTVEKVLEAYPRLTLFDVTQAWAFAAAHRDEIERQIHENEED